MKTVDILTIDEKKEQLSSCIDGQLEQDKLESLLDSLLENSAQGTELRNEWQKLHLISNMHPLDLENKSASLFEQTDEFPLMDVSSEISKKIEQEAQIFPLPTKQELNKPGVIKAGLIKSELLKSDEIELNLTKPANDTFGLFKTLMAGSAIAASLLFVVVNIVNIETTQFSTKQSVTSTQNNKSQNQSNLAASKKLDNYKMVENHQSNFVDANFEDNNQSRQNKIQALRSQDTNVNFYNRPARNSNYTNLIHKVSLKESPNR